MQEACRMLFVKRILFLYYLFAMKLRNTIMLSSALAVLYPVDHNGLCPVPDWGCIN